MLPHFTWSYTTTTHKPTSLISLFSLPHPLSRLNPKTLPSLHLFLPFSFISSFWRPRLSLSKLASSLEVRNFCCMLIWSRNGALILVDLESPFWRFLYDDLDVFLVRFTSHFSQKALDSSPSAMNSKRAEGMVCFLWSFDGFEFGFLYIRRVWCFGKSLV